MLQISTELNGQLALSKSVTQMPAEDVLESVASRKKLSRLIRQMRLDGGFVGKHVVAALPDRRVIYRRLRLAPMPDIEMAEAVHWQLARELDQPADAICTAHYPSNLGNSNPSSPRTVLACAAASKDVEDYAGLLIDAGLLPISIDAGPGAILRCFDPATSGFSDAGTLFVVAMDYSRATLQVFEGNRPSYIRTIPGGRKRLAQLAAVISDIRCPDTGAVCALFKSHGSQEQAHSSEIRDTLDASMPEACRLYARELEQELRMCSQHLNGQESRSRPQRGCLVGAGPWEILIARPLSEAVAVQFSSPVDLLLSAHRDMLSGCDLSDDWLLPLGLACYMTRASKSRRAS